MRVEYLLRPGTRRFHYVWNESKYTEEGPENTDEFLLSQWLAEGRTLEELSEKLIKIYFADIDDGYIAQVISCPKNADDGSAMGAFTKFADGKVRWLFVPPVWT